MPPLVNPACRYRRPEQLQREGRGGEGRGGEGRQGKQVDGGKETHTHHTPRLIGKGEQGRSSQVEVKTRW